MIQATVRIPKHNWNALTRSHQMSFDLGVLLVAKVTNPIKSSSSPTSSWKKAETDAAQSIVCLQQIYSDKFKTAVQGNELTIYLPHFIILNLSKQYRGKQIVVMNTVLAYLPTAYSLPNQRTEREVYQRVLLRSRVLESLHECSEEEFPPIGCHIFTELPVRTRCDAKLRCHFVI